MGLIKTIAGWFFGGSKSGGNFITQTAGAFVPNAEAQAQRNANIQQQAMGEFSAEFSNSHGAFDNLVDALNRLPRPIMAFGVIGLFASAMWSPQWFAARMQGLALVPDQLWWLLGAIVTFYFGARESSYARQTSMAKTAMQIAKQTPIVMQNLQAIEHYAGAAAAPVTNDPTTPNAAISDWEAKRQ